MNVFRSRPISWITVVLWMALIFWLSSIPDLRSGFQPLWDLVLRKFAHAGEYAVLGWLSYRAFAINGVSRNRAVAYAVAIGVLYAASDEYHQTFVPGRNGAFLDASVDAWGALVGVLVRVRWC